MTREHIQQTVTKYLARAVPGLDPEGIDTSRSMKELGANSIDIVEVVSSSMRELRIRIPRAELDTLKNVDDLVSLLHSKAEVMEQAKAG